MKNKLIFLLIFSMHHFFAFAQQTLENKLENSDNYVTFYKEMRFLLFLYLNKNNNLTKEKMRDMEKRNPSIKENTDSLKQKNVDIQKGIINEDDAKMLMKIGDKLQDFRTMNVTTREKSMDSVENNLDNDAKKDILERKELKIDEFAYNQAVKNAKIYLYKVFDEFPMLLERNSQIEPMIQNVNKRLDKKYLLETKSKCMEQTLEFSDLGIYSFIRIESYMYKSTNKSEGSKRRVAKMSPLSSHTSFLTSLYRYKKCSQ
ncbi:MAG: hypothetical protein EAZ85_12360 [Bacteroidetes bacterium]|nr:MAG: hypothetical protein EAZ85_12360 [Bacteroidota bacterium]TAG92937.1 MAG: hypothetical protein EAZ20_02110 [Bacteroidota bacterium]